MATRRKPPPPATATEPTPPATPSSATSPEQHEIAASKWKKIVTMSLIFVIPYLYLLLFHYEVESELKRSILINAMVSAGGFLVTVKLIPVAAKYVLRRNLFGFDINKKGTPGGNIKM